jgi:L-rhamnose mutarotase
MPRVCFTLQVRRDRLADYRARHQEVWPEMQAALQETGWRNYSLFLETDDFEASLRGMAEKEVNARWQASVVDLFEAEPANRAADERMKPILEVFHLD